MEQIKVALYTRVSTKGQEDKDLSIPDQLRQLNEYCQKHNYIIYKEYNEGGDSGTDDKRPIFQEMIRDARIKHPPFNIILVLTFSRFFRDAFKSR